MNTAVATIDGLHDLKPLPEFYLSELVFPILIVSALGLAVFIVWQKIRRKRRVRVGSVLDPHEATLIALSGLETRLRIEEVSVRELLSSLSLILRRYLETVLTYPASELTASENRAQLSGVVARQLSISSKMVQEEICTNILEILCQCEESSYADPRQVVTPRPQELITSARNIVQRLHDLLEKEHSYRSTLPTASDPSLHRNGQNVSEAQR